MTRWGTALAAIALAVAAAVRPVAAQEPATSPVSAIAPPGESRFEIALLGGYFGGGALGDTRADMLTNQVPTSGMTALFTTSTSIGAASTLEGRLGLRIAGGWVIEAGVAYGRPELRVAVSGDVEGAPDVVATSPLSQYIIDGALQYRWRGYRVTPFVAGGAGYLRQLDEPRTSAETGTLYHGGGGVLVRVAPASRSFLRRLALRGDARVVWLRDGVTLNEQRAPTFSVSAGISAGW